jgi:hypothetical protein
MYSNIQERREPPMQPHVGMTVADIEAFVAERKAKALRIDPATCEVHYQYVQVLDPYGLLDVPEEARCIGADLFVRNPGGDIWVWFGDLPEATLKAVRARPEKENDWPSESADLPF